MTRTTPSPKACKALSLPEKIEALHDCVQNNYDIIADLPQRLEVFQEFQKLLLAYDVDTVADIVDVIYESGDSPRRYRNFIKKYKLDWNPGETVAEEKHREAR